MRRPQRWSPAIGIVGIFGTICGSKEQHQIIKAPPWSLPRRYEHSLDVHGMCDPVDVPVPAGRLARRDARQVHVRAEAGRADRVQRRPSLRRPEVGRAGEAARDDRRTREAAPGQVDVAVDAVSAVLHPAAGRSVDGGSVAVAGVDDVRGV